MKSFSKTNCAILRNALTVALASVEKEHGIKFTVGKMRFSESEVGIALEGVIEGATTQADKFFDEMLKMHGFSKTNGSGATLTGYNSRSPKYAWNFKDAGGKGFRASTRHIESMGFKQSVSLGK